MDDATKTGFAGRSNAARNPGGLIGVWAEENSRDSIFDGLKRKEVFGTSGPRIEPRFFGGRDLPRDLCEDPAMLEKAYAQAVPMGGDLPDGAGAPSFLVAATADAGTEALPGTPLQQLQVVKGWYDAEGITIKRSSRWRATLAMVHR